MPFIAAAIAELGSTSEGRSLSSVRSAAVQARCEDSNGLVEVGYVERADGVAAPLSCGERLERHSWTLLSWDGRLRVAG